MRGSLASRLAGLITLLLGITVLLVILASSVALVYELFGFTGDIVIAKHEEARILTEQFKLQGVPLAKAAPQIAKDLSGIGLRVAVYDEKGRFLGGDPNLRPRILARIVRNRAVLVPPPGAGGKHPSANGTGGAALPPWGTRPLQRQTVGRIIYHESVVHAHGAGPVHPEPWALTAVDGGYVAFAPDAWLILVNLVPYWRVMAAIAVVAILLSWFVGRLFSKHALAPLTEVTQSLRALAEGDYTQRRFVTAGGDEIATLTGAYNDAAASVATAMGVRRQTEERMRQFVADAGHELRTPLTVIAGYIDVLRRGAIEEPKVARQILGTMALEKEHMRGLIDRLMRLARLDSEATPRRDPIAVDELLRSQCDAARRLDESRQVDYSVEGVGEIYGDRGELGEALWNIVENALKYAPDAAIHLRACRDGDATVITVRDDGPGMTESERLHAFERFYRGDQRGEITGTGLGLAIAKRAVDRAGGTIAIDSAPGRGTTVTIRI
ncbi:MAG: sensor histidine kinase [Vulcanimicrobiaceae bacterium]